MLISNSYKSMMNINAYNSKDIGATIKDDIIKQISSDGTDGDSISFSKEAIKKLQEYKQSQIDEKNKPLVLKTDNSIEKFLANDINKGMEKKDVTRVLKNLDTETFNKFIKFAKKLDKDEYQKLITTLNSLDHGDVQDVALLVMNEKFSTDNISGLINSAKVLFKDNAPGIRSFVRSLVQNTSLHSNKKNQANLKNFLNDIEKAKDINLKLTANRELTKNIKDLDNNNLIALINVTTRLFNKGTTNDKGVPNIFSSTAVILNNLEDEKTKKEYSKILYNIDNNELAKIRNDKMEKLKTNNLDYLNSFLVRTMDLGDHTSVKRMINISFKSGKEVDKFLIMTQNVIEEEKELKKQGKVDTKEIKKFTDVIKNGFNNPGKGLKELFDTLETKSAKSVESVLGSFKVWELESKKTTAFGAIFEFAAKHGDKKTPEGYAQYKAFEMLVANKDFSDFVQNGDPFSEKIYESIADRVILAFNS